jgi:GNAT superfamily N-acetyltransferase
MSFKQSVTTFFLEMLKVQDFKPKTGYKEFIEVKIVANSDFINWVLFVGVGLPWKWYSRLKWTSSEWDNIMKDNRIQTYLAFHDNHLVGYFELEIHENQSVEIVFLGLLPEFLGKRLGGYLLSHAVETAWGLNANRVWLHTCDNDSNAALNNYLSRGFQIFNQVIEEEEVPEKSEFLEYIQQYFSHYIDKYTQL